LLVVVLLLLLVEMLVTDEGPSLCALALAGTSACSCCEVEKGCNTLPCAMLARRWFFNP